MKHESLHELMIDELRDVYDAEQQIVEALPKMAKAASSTQLKSAFQTHLDQTKGQVQRLEQAFEMIGEKAKTKTCKAMKGLIAEGEDVMKEYDRSPLLDAALVGSAQRIEHYEIAAYGTICAFADAMGHTELSSLLHQTLEEEKQTDALLTQVGERVNRDAPQGMTQQNGQKNSRS